MKTYRFYKDDLNHWYIDLPKFKFNKSWLQQSAGADKLLIELAKGKDEVYVQFSPYPILYSTGRLEKIVNLGINRGALYSSPDFKLTDKSAKEYNQVLLFPLAWTYFLGFPKTIYFKIDNTRAGLPEDTVKTWHNRTNLIFT